MLVRLRGELFLGVGEREYRGGVTYCVAGVLGVSGVVLASSPRSSRWVGVKGMSERSSFDLATGKTARHMLYMNKQLNRRRA